MKTFVLVSALVLSAEVVSAQDTDPEVAYNNHCRTCHTQNEGDNRLGPNLHQIIGREAGSIEGYAFSDALAASGITWDEETLGSWIEDPDSVVVGHKMKPYPGVTDPETRAAILRALQPQETLPAQPEGSADQTDR
ncbi:c-type cytochrome [Puniceibacterium confluentis]|uniref:c-type cytochrome n=1 Tax=Puniceibacterium confluentis TaxID=1958944 RepID=UPI0011B855FE|nr:c-type cytochrome [Puniceibacterium confluentis]